MKTVPLSKPLLTLSALLFIVVPTSIAQTFREPLSASYTGLGSYSTKQNDVFSFRNNQAALAQAKNTAAGVYGERKFLLTATSLYAAAIQVPASMGNFGINLVYAGFKNYNEYQLGLTYARSLGSLVDIGIQFNYHGYRVPAYNSSNAVNFEIGAIIHLTEQLHTGVHVYNPMGGKFAKTGEQLAAVYKAGIGYDASDKFFVSAEVVKVKEQPVHVNAGVQYQFVKQFFARAGISTASSAAYGGVGIGWKNLRLDITGSYHPQLGWSPGLLLIIMKSPPAPHGGF
ncbi:MAG: hypothetical protein ABIN01_23300 [Ferruginibacter sp.]